jgi:hypothetical protein
MGAVGYRRGHAYTSQEICSELKGRMGRDFKPFIPTRAMELVQMPPDG